ncbi:MAG: thiamine pyrophosphate-dependent enzyme [Candidatus Saccharimonadales bacterium]
MSSQKSILLPELANAFKKGGIESSFNFPGFHSHELFEYLGGGVTSTNEKIAYEIAWGSSQAGRQSLVTFKNVGLNDAADPFINSHLTGVGEGLVLVVFDDIELEGSQCILDSRHYASFYGGLWIEPYNYESALIFAEAAPQLSKIFDLPVVMRLTNISVAFKPGIVPNYTAQEICRLAKDVIAETDLTIEPIVHPINGDAQRNAVVTKNKLIQRFVNKLHCLINPEKNYSYIAVGSENSDATSAIATLPVPDIEQLLSATIQEVGDSVIADALNLKMSNGKFASSRIGYNSKNAEHYIRTKRYERLFRLLKPNFQYITGDLGEYTKDTLNTLTHCLCFGSAVSAAMGIGIAGGTTLAITGDASYYHSAKNAWQEAVDRGLKPKLVLLDNGGSQGTGGQLVPGKIDESIEMVEIDYDMISDSELEAVVKHFCSSAGAMILKVNHEV